MKIGLRTDEVKTSPWAEILAFLKLNGTTGAKRLKTLFRDLDQNNDNNISIEELTEGFEKIGLRLDQEQIASFHADCDINGEWSGYTMYLLT